MSPNSSTGLYMPQTYSFLSPETFETLVEGYINQLHIRKRNKALITQQLANDCLMVLTNPENTAIFNPKFRWWVRKHFVFTVVGELRILLDKKNGKPVCVREQLYDKVCYFHHIIGHGGRDKTFAAITKSYSKVPAELVSLFTKNCQTCLGVRKYSKNKRPILPENEYPPHHPHHQQQQQQSSAASTGLTCDTGFSTTSSTIPSATSTSTQYHTSSSSQQQYGMLNKGDQGAMTPISPLMHASNSGFFSNTNNGQFNTGYNYPQQSTQQQQQQQFTQLQQQQIQQMHNVAMQAHHMSLSMGFSELSLGNSTGMTPSDMSGLSGLGQLSTNGLHGSMSALSSACSTPTTMVKMDLPVVHAFDNNLISLAHLTQQSHYQTLTDGTTDMDDATSSIHHHMYDRDQVDSFAAAAAVAAGQYSPLLEHEYQNAQSQYQDAYSQHAYTTHDYTAYTTEPQSTYSMAISSLASMTALMPSQASNGYDHHHHQQQPHDYSATNAQEHSPLLSQNQMFQKQIQQEQQRFHQQQQHLMTSSSTSSSATNAPVMTTPPTLNVSTSLSSLSTSASSSSLASPPPSAVPSLTCSISTPTTATSSSLHSEGTSFHPHHHQQHHQHHLTGLLDHETKNRLGAVSGLISGVVHDL